MISTYKNTKQNIMIRTELLEHYLKPTDLTVKELIDRDAFAQIMQFAEAYRLEQLRIGGVSKSVTAKDLKCPKCKQHALMKYIDGKECTSCGYGC